LGFHGGVILHDDEGKSTPRTPRLQRTKRIIGENATPENAWREIEASNPAANDSDATGSQATFFSARSGCA
jgi:hypothetical protein